MLGAIHALACAQPGCTPDSNATLTGYAGNGLVPEPGSALLLLVSGVFGVVNWGIRRRVAA
jgi:hypothetical protein